MSKIIPGFSRQEDGTLSKRLIPVETDTEVTLDDLLKDGLTAIRRILKACLLETSGGSMPERDSVMNLKDCMAMIHELKKKEQDLLDGLTDEQLANFIEGDKK